jgi:hypothetical protein
MGGTMESFYIAFGDDYVNVIADLPDNAAASVVALAVNASSSVHIHTVVLVTPEEVGLIRRLGTATGLETRAVDGSGPMLCEPEGRFVPSFGPATQKAPEQLCAHNDIPKRRSA